ncbi:hypothetical protein BaRGS_00038432, partial [Batillaria attramentaria]
FSSPVGHAGLALIMVGILLTVVSLCGGFGAGCENPTLLLAFVVVSCVIFIGEAIVFAELLPPAQSFHEGARNGLVSHIRQFYQVQGHNTISTLLNQAMELAKCCGVEGPGDFKNLSLTYAHAGRVDKVKVPLACCNNDDDTDAGSASDREHRILRCAIYGDGDDLSLNGCYTPLLNALGDWETAVYLDFGFTVVLQVREEKCTGDGCRGILAETEGTRIEAARDIYSICIVTTCLQNIFPSSGTHELRPLLANDGTKYIHEVLNREDSGPLGALVNYGGIGMMVVGFPLFLLSFAGWWGACCEDKFFWMGLAGLLCMQGAVVALVLAGVLQSDVKKAVVDDIQTGYQPQGENGISVFLNSLMGMAGCCGATGPDDFQNTEMTADGQPLKVPPVCCNASAMPTKSEEEKALEAASQSSAYKDAMDCAAQPGKNGLYPVAKGCLEKFFEDVEKAKSFMFLLLVASLIVQGGELFIAHFIWSRMPDPIEPPGPNVPPPPPPKAGPGKPGSPAGAGPGKPGTPSGAGPVKPGGTPSSPGLGKPGAPAGASPGKPVSPSNVRVG